jgi:hypothetical protein
MSAKSLLQDSLNNCQLVRDSLSSAVSHPELELELLDCIQKLETILEELKDYADWDAESFASFLETYRAQRRIKRDMAAITHLVTPLCPVSVS